METPIFRPFNEAGEVRVYVRNLPHWRQPGATYFVTFRQDDAIPAKVVAQWHDERQRWYRAHGLDPSWQRTDPGRFDAAYAAIDPAVCQAFEREQARQLHHQLDQGHGSCVLRHAEPRAVLAEALAYFDAERFWMGDFVIMPNHCHALVLPLSGWELEDLLGSIKKWSSRKIGLWLQREPKAVRPSTRRNSKPRFYQQESYDRIVRDGEELAAFRRYIARNAAEASLPPEPGIRLIGQDKIDQFNRRMTELRQDLEKAVWRLDEQCADARSVLRRDADRRQILAWVLTGSDNDSLLR